MLIIVLAAFAMVPAKAVSAAADEDVLYIAMQEDLPDFNEWNLGSNSVWKNNVIGMGFESLSTADYDLRPVPLLAEDWDFDEVNLIVDIYLREGVLFHDMTEMTAEDVKFTYMMVRDGTTYSSNILPAFDENGDNVLSETEIYDGIEIVSPYHLKMYMAGDGYGQFFSSTLGVPIVPKHIWEDHVDSENRVIVTWSHPDATIGTGAWYYAEGVQNSYRVMKKFDAYWGKETSTPAGMPLFPQTVDTLFYKIYTSIDTAILALQGGQVDYIAWAVTSGRIPALQSDPNIALEYMSDAGYFYMAFNMKKEPMNNLTFRQAVSHLVDKDQIVDVYMGGFGQAGSAAVSPFFGEWYNPAVTKYPFDIELAKDLLDEAGFDDVNGDGWREMPDGSLMEKITLLTPPADYDPIRIRAGQMIATNMREAGINCEAKPIDFNTLVAKLVAFDYQMLIIGWSFTGYTECVSVLYDIYGASAASNSWGFWSDENPNPYYSEIGGVSTLADEATQELVNEFTVLENAARTSFDVAEQIDLVKQGQQIIAEAVPCNILYYRVNVEAHNTKWTNWTVFDGSLMNSYNVCTLEYSGTGGTSGGGAVATLSAGLTVTEKVKCDETVPAYVKAVNNLGGAVSGAAVEVTVTDGISATPLTGTTNANGVFEFELTGEAVGVSTVTVNVTSDTLEATDSASVRVTSLGGIGVQVMPEKTILDAGEDISVEVSVTDVNGDPVEGATVTIDPYLLGYGSISPDTIVTGAAGTGTMTYSAPDEQLPNQHMLVQLATSVSHPKYTLTNFAASTIAVYNDDAPDWHMTTVESVTTTALSEASPTTTIEVLATDAAGAPLASEVLGITYSDDALVDTPETEVTTDGSGLASFDVTFADVGDDAALRVTIGNRAIANSIMDTVTLTYSPTGVLNDLYGGYVQYSDVKFVDALGSIDVDFLVFDSEGNPANVTSAVVVAGTSYGQLTDWAESQWNSLWDYAGLNILTEADGQNIVTAGSYAAPEFADVPDWWVYVDTPGIEVVNGTYSMTVEGVDMAHLDLVMDLFLVPNATADFSTDTGNHEIYGMTTISSEYGYARATELSSTVFEIEKPVLQAKASEFDETSVTVTAYDENNDPLVGATVELYGSSDYMVDPPSADSSATGVATFDILAAAYNAATGEYDDVVRATNPTMYVTATMDGKLTLLSQTQLVIQPLRESVYLQVDPLLDIYAIGDALVVTTTVVDDAGTAYADLPVSIGASLGSVVTTTVLTDDDGVATMVIDTSGISDAAAAVAAVELSTGGTPEGATARMMVALQNSAPTIAVSAPADDGEAEGPDVDIIGTVSDSNGISEVTITLDDGTPMQVALTEGSIAVALSEVLSDVGNGEHTVTISATDSLGVSAEAEVTFTVVDAAGDGGADMLAWALAAVGWIVAALLLVVLFLRMRKPKPETSESSGGADEVEEALSEEPLPEPEKPG